MGGEINLSFNRQDTARRTGEIQRITTRNPVYDNSQYHIESYTTTAPRTTDVSSNVYHVSLRPESRISEGEPTTVVYSATD